MFENEERFPGGNWNPSSVNWTDIVSGQAQVYYNYWFVSEALFICCFKETRTNLRRLRNWNDVSVLVTKPKTICVYPPPCSSFILTRALLQRFFPLTQRLPFFQIQDGARPMEMRSISQNTPTLQVYWGTLLQEMYMDIFMSRMTLILSLSVSFFNGPCFRILSHGNYLLKV